MKFFPLALVVLVSLPACKGAGILSGDNVLKTSNAIQVQDHFFSPSSYLIQAGDSITFNWFGNNTNMHQVDVTGPGTFDQKSPNQTAGTFTVVFPSPGLYTATDVATQFTAAITVVNKP